MSHEIFHPRIFPPCDVHVRCGICLCAMCTYVRTHVERLYYVLHTIEACDYMMALFRYLRPIDNSKRIGMVAILALAW